MNRHGLFLLAAMCGVAQAASTAVTHTVFDTVGSDPTLPGSSGGSRNNTNTWATGEVGRFLVIDSLGYAYGLSVFATSPSGTLTAGTDSLMVVRTVNSQGLTDSGTLSILVFPGDTGAATAGRWTLNVRFAFFDATFTTPYAPQDLALTTLDLDHGQRYYTRDADFSSNELYPGTRINFAPTGIAGYTGFTAAGSSAYTDARHAVTSHGNVGATEFNVILSSTSQALYMFEFRNPSLVLSTPEPSAGLMAFGGLLLFAVGARVRTARKNQLAVAAARR